MKKVTERRRVHRCLMESELILFHRSIPVKARLLDLSIRGARVVTTEYLRKQTPITLLLPVSSRHSLMLKARVSFYREGNGAGIKFISLTQHQEDQITELIKTFTL
ncbi:MAG TPA: PilZ domain-containing protein [Blastocatellia bacterium]|nr:PilZ domain-containing protein [Blastocatellia bacterium]